MENLNIALVSSPKSVVECSSKNPRDIIISNRRRQQQHSSFVFREKSHNGPRFSVSSSLSHRTSIFTHSPNIRIHVTAKAQSFNSQKIFISHLSSSTLNISGLTLSLPSHQTPIRLQRIRSSNSSNSPVVVASAKAVPLKIMISGAPASGKGTQCELITKKYGLVHIAAGDLLRTEIAAGSENGKVAKEYMERGQLVPDEIVVMMVKERLLQSDAQESGWLLDGYPRSASQATAIKDFGFRPDLFILLDVSEDILVERVVGRRLDPFTGKIYHLKYSPPETEEIAARLTQRFDDTEEKVKMRLRTHHQNVGAVLSMYEDITIKVNGNVSMEDVFAQIDHALTTLIDEKANSESVVV